jgi:hypothetical protein
MFWCLAVPALIALSALVIYFLYSRHLWSAVNRDFAIATQAMKKVEQLAKGWHDCADKDERHRCLENARRELQAAHRCGAERADYKLVRTYLDDALWWLATLLIAHEPEYLQDLFGENREMIRHLFWSWNGSMDWDGVSASQEQAVLRKVRLALYREIASLSQSKLLPDAVLLAASLCLQKRDYPGKTANARLDAERNYIAGALRSLQAHRDAAQAAVAKTR